MAKRITFVFMLILLFFGEGVQVAYSGVRESSLYQNSTSDEEKCWPLDIVILIDQSGSMSGVSGNNDPDGYRFEAAREVLEQLTRNKQEQCVNVEHRLSIITFGVDAKTHLYLSPISLGENDDPDEWSKNYLQNISEAERRPIQEYTNFIDAFEEAQTVFGRAKKPNDSSSYGERRQIVILVTDGKPTSSSNDKDHICKLKSYLEEPFWTSKSIYVVALNASVPYLDDDGCNNRSIRQDLQDISLIHGGQLYDLPYNRQAIPTSLGDIVAKEFGQISEPVSCNDVFYLDPYLQKVEFRFYRSKDDANSRVTISKLDGSGNPMFTLRDGDVELPSDNIGEMNFSSDNYDNSSPRKEEYIIDNPLPGAWSYEVDGMDRDECQRRIEGRKIDFFADVSLEPGNSIALPQIPVPPYYEEKYPINYEVKLWNKNANQLIQNDPNYNLVIDLYWTLPSGEKTLTIDDTPVPNPIRLTPVGGGKWENTDTPVLTPNDGKYTIELVGLAPAGDPFADTKLVEVFRETKYFYADLLTRFEYEVLSPTPEKNFACNRFESSGDENTNTVYNSVPSPVFVELDLRDREGNPIIDPSEYIDSNLNSSFLVRLFDRDNEDKLLDEADLSFDEDAGKFIGKLLNGNQGERGCGNLLLIVEFSGYYDETKFALVRKNAEIEFGRVEASGIVATVDKPDESKTMARFDNVLLACSDENVSPIPIKIKLTDLDGASPEINWGLDEEEGKILYDVNLQRPFSDTKMPVDIVLESEGDSVFLFGSVNGMIDGGEYTLYVSPIKNQFPAGYTWAQEEFSLSFTRQDTFFINANACYVARGGLGILSAIVLGLIIFALTGGPGGKIQFLDERQDHLKYWALSKMRVMALRKYSSPSLRENGIKYVQFSKGSGGKSTRVVHLKIMDNNNDVIWDSGIEANISIPITSEIGVLYTHEKHRDADPLIF
jgi:uncharacterized protein YegL